MIAPKNLAGLSPFYLDKKTARGFGYCTEEYVGENHKVANHTWGNLVGEVDCAQNTNSEARQQKGRRILGKQGDKTQNANGWAYPETHGENVLGGD